MSTNRTPDAFGQGGDFFSDEDYYFDEAGREYDNFSDGDFDQAEFEREFGGLSGSAEAYASDGGRSGDADGYDFDDFDDYADNNTGRPDNSAEPVYDDAPGYDDRRRDDNQQSDSARGYDDVYGYAYDDGYDDGYRSGSYASYDDYDSGMTADRAGYDSSDSYSWGDDQYGDSSPARRSSFIDRLANLSRGKRIALYSTLISLLLIINIVAAGLSYFNHLMDGFDYDHDDEPYVVSFTDQPIADEGEGLQEGVSYTDVDEDQLMASINEVTVGDDHLFHQDGTTNILLLGTDAREKGGFARSDAIILLSVNRNSKQIVMTSFLRDTAVLFEGAQYSDKLTHGYGYGKGPLMVKTIQSHFGVKIDYYMAIDFFAFIDVVDYLGGIELEITEDERKVMNNYVKEINDLQGLLPDNGFLWKTGKVTVTGKQALGYARNRYSKSGAGGGDFGRSARQRIVLGAIIDKLKSDPTKAFGLLEAIAPQIKTDYTKEALTAEVTNALEYISYEIITTRVPADDTWHYGNRNGMSMVICDFEANQKLMIKNIYGVDVEDYTTN